MVSYKEFLIMIFHFSIIILLLITPAIFIIEIKELITSIVSYFKNYNSK